MAKKTTKKEVSLKEKEKPFEEIQEEPKEEPKKEVKKEIVTITKKVYPDYVITTIYYKDGTSEEIKKTNIKRA